MTEPRTITLAAPGKNALSLALMETLVAEVRAAAGAPLFFTGAGDAFSAGLNLKEVHELDQAGLGRFLTLLEDLVGVLYEYPGPTVAFVNGHAIAGGCIVALCCDVRVMTARPGARIGLNEVALGLQFPPRTLAMVRRRLTGPALERVLLDAALYLAPEALQLGLVDALGEEADARARLAAMAAHPAQAFTAAKRALRGALEVSPEALRRFSDEVVPTWAAPELKARLRAVLKK